MSTDLNQSATTNTYLIYRISFKEKKIYNIIKRNNESNY